jgi:hypothetical protein
VRAIAWMSHEQTQTTVLYEMDVAADADCGHKVWLLALLCV